MGHNVVYYGRTLAGCLWILVELQFTSVVAQPTVSTFLLNGVAAPDGNGQFLAADAPVLNDAGELSFLGLMTNTTGGGTLADRMGVFRLSNSNLEQVARGLVLAPQSPDVFGSQFTNPPPMNSQGQVAFTARRNGFAGDAGVYRGIGGPLTVIADRLDAPPDGNGTFNSFTGTTINTAGQVAFVGGLSGTTPADVNSGVYRGEEGSLDEIVRRQDLAPDGNGVFTTFHNPAINDAIGQVAFAADLSPAGAASGVFRSLGGGLEGVTQIARQGNPAPDVGSGINGRFDLLGTDVALNNVGQVAFSSTLSNTSGGSSDNAGLFRGTSEFDTQLIARKGQAPPEGNGLLSSFSPAAINSFGSVAFRATLSGTSGGGLDNDGIYVGDGFNLTTVVRGGAPAPDGNGTFEVFNALPIINNAGQVAFTANFQNASVGTENGLYFWSPSAGLMEVARVGDSFLGSTITQLRWAQRTGAGDLEHSGLNDNAQVAYSFRLADNTEGLAIWSANLTVTPTGDYDGDGDVDGRDFLLWQRGQSPNGVNSLDLAVWKVRYGTTLPLSGVSDVSVQQTSQTVPEPRLQGILALSALILGLRRNCFFSKLAG